jgi:phosphoesterase RecJ-like protein
MHRISRQIYDKLMKSDKILIIPHQKPDGDALGSATAMARFLDNAKKNFYIFCHTASPANFFYLPYSNKITSDPSIWLEHKFDSIIVLDSGDLNYAGTEKYIIDLKYEPHIINIDHHPTNDNFGHHNLVSPTSSSTAEVVYNFFKHNGVKIDQEIALSLLTGIITDTDNFTNAGTNFSSLEIASNLIRLGGNLNLIRGYLFRDKSVNSLKLWGIALSRLEKNEEFNIIHTYLTRADLLACGASDGEADGIANYLNNLNDGRAGIILKETSDGKISVSFRTTNDNFDVSVIAKKLGGGGHRKAAGFTGEGTISEVLNTIWLEIEKLEKIR